MLADIPKTAADEIAGISRYARSLSQDTAAAITPDSSSGAVLIYRRMHLHCRRHES